MVLIWGNFGCKPPFGGQGVGRLCYKNDGCTPAVSSMFSKSEEAYGLYLPAALPHILFGFWCHVCNINFTYYWWSKKRLIHWVIVNSGCDTSDCKCLMFFHRTQLDFRPKKWAWWVYTDTITIKHTCGFSPRCCSCTFSWAPWQSKASETPASGSNFPVHRNPLKRSKR